MATPTIAHTTGLLLALSQTDMQAGKKLVPLIYDQLHAIAGKVLASNPRATLQPTELIHEAYLRMIDPSADADRWHGQVHFQRVAARAMRFVLVDRARSRLAQKRGGAARAVTLNEDFIGKADEGAAALQVHEGLERLAEIDEQLAQLVELRFFGGLSMDEIAKLLGISPRSAARSWRLARAWWIEEYGDEDADA